MKFIFSLYRIYETFQNTDWCNRLTIINSKHKCNTYFMVFLPELFKEAFIIEYIY
jgi:hypothetical protein